MRLIYLFLIISSITINGGLFAQDLKLANELFENFEYENSKVEYEKFDDLSKLDTENQENLGFCYYITGDFESGLPFIRTIIKPDDNRAHLWLWKGTLEKENKEFDKAIESFNTFKSKTNELDSEVDILIKSCQQIPTWDSVPRSSIKNQLLNSGMAESYSIFENKVLYFKEIGLDGEGKIISSQNKNDIYAEAFVMKPYLLQNDTLLSIDLFKNYPGLSINRIQKIPNSNQVIFSAADLLNKNDFLKNQQIYVADFASLNTPLNTIKLWQYSGIKDSSSCSHPTVSINGEKLVFTKSSYKTEGSDLYISELQNGSWNTPKPLNECNSFGNEMFPLFQNDSILLFSSDGRVGYGGLDIYSFDLNSRSDQEVYHFHAPINSQMDDYNLFWQDSLNALLVSNRNTGKGDDDLWTLNIEPKKIPEIVDDGFTKWYEAWNLKRVYFDFDSFESEVNQEFISGCKRYFEKYKVSVKLVGHTDSRGLPEYNLALGLNRCKWLETQLKNAKVQNTITLESVGETQLVNKCNSTTKCSDNEHLENRFVQIFISFDLKTQE
jgi:outer membrane protein OmpA-like peptidoglycan-associated protein